MVQVAIYARVSTKDQDCARQLRDLNEYCAKRGFDVVATFTEKASGAKNDRIERRKVIKLAQSRKIDAVVVTELSRWGRSLIDLVSTLQDFQALGVSLIAQTGQTFDLSTPNGRLMASVMSALAEFERDLTRERVMSGLASAKAKGMKLGRQCGQNPSDKYAGKVLQLIDQGESYRAVADRLRISKTTVQAIVKRRAKEPASV